jgi:DNA helicase-2/ATP-dependent DNA helicase PcrA
MPDIVSSEIPAFLQSLNPRQLEAVLHEESPLLIIAGAGTGKTTTLAHRVAWQIASGVDPSRMLLLTFTRRAAAEMLRRVESIILKLEPATLKDPSVAAAIRGSSDLWWHVSFGFVTAFAAARTSDWVAPRLQHP